MSSSQRLDAGSGVARRGQLRRRAVDHRDAVVAAKRDSSSTIVEPILPAPTTTMLLHGRFLLAPNIRIVRNHRSCLSKGSVQSGGVKPQSRVDRPNETMSKCSRGCHRRALLAALRDNARASTAELARAARRVAHHGAEPDRAAGAAATSSPATVGVPDALEAALVRAHVLITVAPRQSAAIEVALRRIPEVRVLHSVSGPFDLIAIVAGAVDRRARRPDRPHRRPRRRRAHHLVDRAVDAHRALTTARRFKSVRLLPKNRPGPRLSAGGGCS